MLILTLFEAKIIKEVAIRVIVQFFLLSLPCFLKEERNDMKLISWNVNGLRACEGKGFSDIFRELDADFFCLQETKMQ